MKKAMKEKLDLFMCYHYESVIEHNPIDNTYTAYHPQFGQESCYGVGKKRRTAISKMQRARRKFFERLLSENKEIPMPEGYENESN